MHHALTPGILAHVHRSPAGSALTFATLIAIAVLGAEGAARADVPKTCAAASERAQSRRIEGKLVAARAELLTCAKAECPAVVRQDCEAWLKEVDQSLPSIVVGARTADGKDVLEARVLLDGALASDALTGKAVPLDPGVHELRVEHPGDTPVVERVVVREGEKNRLITVVFGAPAPAKRESPVPERPPPPPDGVKEANHRPIPAAAYVTAGVGVAALIAAGVFGGLANARYDELEDTCGRTRSCPKDAIDDVKTRAVTADIALGVGVVAIAAAAVIFFTRPTVVARTALGFLSNKSGAGLLLSGGF